MPPSVTPEPVERSARRAAAANDVAADSAELVELRAKATLLVRREQELQELRQERHRTELWFQVFQRLSLDTKVAEAPLAGWVSAMVGELGFQVAAAHACRPDLGCWRLITGAGPTARAEQGPLSQALYDTLARTPSGQYSSAAPEELGPLADGLGLRRFCYLLLPNRKQRLLLLAGFADEDGGCATSPADFSHFVLLGHHVAAQLDNANLIAELDEEKSVLGAYNMQLDISVRELSDAQDKLRQSASALAEVSRRAGMADVATGVLHNVGNALNSVNVSAEVALERLRGLRISGVTRVAELLDAHAGDLPGLLADPTRSPQILAYLRELGTHLDQEKSDIVGELGTLQSHVEHIKAIVSKQQAYAMTVDVSQPCRLEELVDDAVALNDSSLSDIGVRVVREYAPVPELVVDRHKVLEILVNLVSNARHAMVESSESDKKLVLRVYAAGEERAAVEVEDNGVGISAEHVQKLFRYGFTTKLDGHGFGLHTSAVAAEELGGSIRCRSEGRGRGASFVLELPLRRAVH